MTLKKLIEVFQEIAERHQVIQSFGNGDIFQINAETELNHPTLWVDVQPSGVENNLIRFTMLIYVFATVDQSDYAELDAKSDTATLMNDVITLLRNSYQLIDYHSDTTMTPFVQKFNDRCVGWFTEVEIEVPTIYGNCDIPFDIEPFPEKPLFLDSANATWEIKVGTEGNLESFDVQLPENTEETIYISSNGYQWALTINDQGSLITEKI